MGTLADNRALSAFPASAGADGIAALKQLVLDAVSSPLTRVMYARALDDFFGWWTGQGRPPFTRATVQAWRAALEAKGLPPASVNQKLSAVRKLATEAVYNGLLGPATAQAIRDIRGAEQRGVRTGKLAHQAPGRGAARRPRSGDEARETGPGHPSGMDLRALVIARTGSTPRCPGCAGTRMAA